MRILLLLLVCTVAGCGATGPGTTVSGGNPAAPPGPPAEIPSALRFPSDLGIDVDTIASGSPEADTSALAALVGSGGQFSEEISFAADLVPILTQQVNGFLQPLPELLIPASTSTTTFEATFTPPPGPETQPAEGEIDIKIDFADFGGNGCSGHTAALPVCFRIWFNGERRMAGLFTKFPTPDNPGAGSYRTSAQGDDPEADVVNIAVTYDHSDPFDKFTEIFEKGSSSSGTETASPGFHIQVSQEGADATARKTLLMSGDGLSPEFSSDVTGVPANIQYVGRWREDNDFWSGSVATQNVDIQNFSDVCALISTGNSSNQLNCLDLGIDVADIPFLDFLTLDDIGFPADFQVSPTF